MLSLLKHFKLLSSVSLIALIGHALGFGREVATAYYFGASQIADGIVIGLVPLVLYTSIFGTAYANAAMVQIKTPDNHRTIANSAAPLFLIGAIFALLFLLFANGIVKGMAPGLTGEGFDIAVAFVRFSSVGVFLVSLSFWGRGLLYLERRFVRATLSDLMPNLGAIAGIALLYWWLGIYGLVFGGIAGYFLQFLVVTRWHFLRFDREAFSALLGRTQLDIYKAAGLAALSYSVIYVDILVDRYFASSLGEGSIAVMNFAYKLMQFPLYTVIFAMSMIAFPDLISANSDQTVFKRKRDVIYLQTVSFAVLVSIFAFVFAPLIVDLAFNYGSFDDENAVRTSQIFKIYVVGLLGHSLVLVSSKVHYALNSFMWPLIAGVFAATCNVVLNILLVEKYGIEGLAFATSFSAFLNAAILVFASLRRK